MKSFNKASFLRGIVLAIAAHSENDSSMAWKDISAMAREYGFPADGNYLIVRGILQDAINSGIIVRAKDVHTERYTLA
jgi:hypothetical protein